MIKQLQMGIKLLRYAYGKKINTILGLIMFLVGMAMELFAGGNSGFSMGSYFILITALWPLQMLISLNVPAVVAASPWKKKIQTSVFVVSEFFYFLVTYGIVVLVKLFRYKNGTLSTEALTAELLMVTVFMIMLILYMAFSLKYFVVSTVVFVIMMYVFMIGYQAAYYMGMLEGIRIAPAVNIISGVAVLLVGCLLSYVVLCLLYKKPISKYSQMSSLRKKM